MKHHSRRPRRQPLRKMRVDEFYSKFGVTGENGILHRGGNNRVSFALDGWSAAIAAVQGLPLFPGDEELRAVLLKERIATRHLPLESILVSNNGSMSHVPVERNSEEGTRLAGLRWVSACTSLGVSCVPAPPEITILRPCDDHFFSGVEVRLREPVYYPPPHLPPTAPAFSFNHIGGALVPRSAIFFASRMHHLRTLARKRRILEAARQPEDSGIQPEDFDIDSKDSDREPEDSDLDPKDSEEVEPEDSKVVKRATAEKTYIDREISSTFLSMTLYMAGVSAIDLRNLEGEESISLALTTPSAREVGKRVCGFVPEEWLRLYKAGTQFYTTYRVAGSSGILHREPGAHTGLALDGWATAIATVQGFTLTRSQTKLRDLLLQGRIETKYLALESITMFSQATAVQARFPHPRYNNEGTQLASESWGTMCTGLGFVRPIPSKITIMRPPTNDSFRGINVNIHEPLYFPAFYNPISGQAPGFNRFPRLHFPTDLVPRSAVFYASRLHCLRLLATEWKRDHNVPSERATPRKADCEKEIYSILLQVLLYMIAIRAPGNSTLHNPNHVVGVEAHDSGKSVCEFYAVEWLNTYRAGSACGSELFGLEGGFEKNWDFLLENEGPFQQWFENAAHWWVPGQTPENDEDREALITGLERMKNELLTIYQNLHTIKYNQEFVVQSRQEAA
ncbi:hypothetical protein JCM16303_003307 [Sporobolomyces ruberrimus]